MIEIARGGLGMINVYIALVFIVALGGFGLRALIYGVSKHLEGDDL
jgi:hypothetical protein